ncbi:putative kinesin [Trypanosoma rangeli]|uniref:Kinesin-like protein n=1 Tax=Trypanosoma rangeli TaxID=5698 RepID=A0A3R7N2Z7_TRYRA|nr:putative kinesin [Trypanosoma rangeli]RNE99261.1 putative kinesin [Trypanosoma rangeli]|eukprot:RNE99261.1 putative kinesin [Trypanosoma rangeli]
MTEKVSVAARIRPLPCPNSMLATAPLDERRVCVANRRVYHVDRVYDRHESTDVIFFESVVTLVDRFLAGYNATVLAYGQTGTGKTYTMDGLTPLVVRYIVDSMSNSTSKLSFQCVEVYGEALRDLLTSDPTVSSKHLQLHESDGDGGAVVVVGASRVKARNIAEVQDIINHGSRMRTTGATNVHEHSSRSHSIFTIFNHERQSKLNLVDLAGSERNKKTQNVGQRFRESIAINGGLLALGNVIRALSRNHFQFPDNPRHVPYRSSKLTRLLRDSLGGNSSTLLIACVAADVANSDETTRTLQYGALAMHILNEPLPQFDEQVAAAVAAVREANASHGHGSTARTSGGGGGGETPPSAPAEVAWLRQRVVGLEEQVQRCRDELKNDEAVFAQQIKDMRLLLEENESLRRRVAFLEGRPTATPRSTPDVRHGCWQQPQPQQQYTSAPLLPNVDYVQSTLQLYGISPQENGHEIYSHSAPQPIQAVWGEETTMRKREGHLQNELLKRPVDAARWDEAAAAVTAADRCNYANVNGEACGEGARPLTMSEDQLGLLAKEALYYQNSNSELRRRLRTVLAMYEAQQREAAMLRLEVKQIHDLLDGPPHS